MSKANQQQYWDDIADVYQDVTQIACDDFHYGPLLPGDSALNLLPQPLVGKQCLELASGAAQNSIYLAANGATCTAVDISPVQLERARKLAAAHDVSVTCIQGAWESLDQLDLGTYDLVHSSFGLPFAEDPGQCVDYMANHLLAPGGDLLISLAHPVSAGEWLEVAEEGEGMFLTDYFSPPADIREVDNGDFAFSRSYPISTSINWLLSAGLELTAVLEPAPSADNTPYYSDAWDACSDQLTHIPIVVILKAHKPG